MNWAMEKSLLAAYTPTLRTEPVLRTVPVLRMAYFPKRAYDALFSKTLMLQSLRDLRWCGIKSGNLRVSRHLSGGLTRSCSVQFLSAAAGREEIGEGACGPLPLAPYPKGTTPQSAAADSSPYTGEPKNNPSGAARQLPLRGAFESVRPASGGRWERGCRGSDSSPAGNAPRRGKMMCGFCAVAASPQSAAAANGEETGGRCGVRRPRSG